jgi:hypothetical protein
LFVPNCTRPKILRAEISQIARDFDQNWKRQNGDRVVEVSDPDLKDRDDEKYEATSGFDAAKAQNADTLEKT